MKKALMNFGVFVLQEARISVTLYMYKIYPFSFMQTPKIPTKQIGFLINNPYIKTALMNVGVVG